MDVKLLYQPSYTMANVRLAANEEIRAESGSMVSMGDGIIYKNLLDLTSINHR